MERAVSELKGREWSSLVIVGGGRRALEAVAKVVHLEELDWKADSAVVFQVAEDPDEAKAALETVPKQLLKICSL